MTHVIAGDLGGTHCRLALATVQGRNVAIQQEKHYPAGDFTDFETVLDRFIQACGSDIRPQAACFAVAGPVQDQCARLTNLPWVLDASSLEHRFGLARAALINDFAANGYSLAVLGEADCHVLQAGQPDGGNRVVLGAGTGLGMALVTGDAQRPQVLSSEGGHMDFAPLDDAQADLLRYLRGTSSRVSYEQVLSGPGLVRIYDYYVHRRGIESRVDLQADDAPARISELALEQQDPQALETLALFCRIYGSCAANLALVGLSSGGVYLAGGIAVHLREVIERSDFLATFNNKPPMQALLQRMPVKIIINPRAGLLGAAWYAGNQSTDSI